MPRLQTLRAALRLLGEETDRGTRIRMAWSLLLVLASGGLLAVAPLALKHLIDALTATGTAHVAPAQILVLCTTYLLVLLAARLAADLRPLLAGQVEQRVAARLRQRFLAHLLRLPAGYLIKRRSGELLHSLELAAAGTQLLIAHLTNSLAPVLVELVVMAVILWNLQQPALLVLFGVTAVLYLIAFALGAFRLRQPAHDVSSASLDVHARLSEGIAHAETLRCFGAESQAEGLLHTASSRLTTCWSQLHRRTARLALGVSAIFSIALTAFLFIAVRAVLQGQMSVGGFVLAGVYLLQMVRPLEVLGAAARDLARTLGFMRPLLAILAEPAEETPQPATDRSTAPRRPACAPSIRFEDLHFAYDAAHPVIRGLTLEIPAGKTTALVGPSGSGKSTLIRLLLRLYAPSAGRILVDDRPIDSLPAAQLRAWIGLVAQHAGLLHTTAADNIALGLADARRLDIEAAARGAQIHDRLDTLPDGYDTVLGEQGQALSGGERQRLAIARALLRRPLIYLLDEPTSMLDSKTEAEILHCLKQATAGCTTLVVAHRLSTIVHADEIAVIDAGQLRERGTHAELLARNGLYAQLWRRQTTAPDSVG